MNKEKVTIIGGGVMGVCSAYYLIKAGFEVEIIDPSFSDEGTSYGNAGMIVPSHFVPMASPGIIAKGVKWMFDSSSPFYIKPRLNVNLAQWLWKFTRSCTETNVQSAQELIWNFNMLSKQEYENISEDEAFNFSYDSRGLLMLYKKEKSKKEELELAEKAEHLGLKLEILDQYGVQKLNPNVQVDVLGGVYYSDDAHLYSNRFMTQMILHLKSKGVRFIRASVLASNLRSNKISELHLSNKSSLKVSNVVLSAGAWSGNIAKELGLKLLLEDGKGYSITQENIDIKPTIPSILTDEKVAITPMENDLRITGTLEISGINNKVNYKRVNAFLSAVPDYFPNIPNAKINQTKIWTGYRPLSFDGVPYIGRSQKLKNVIVATGHGMMGMSLGPATGKLVSQIISEEKTELPLDLMKLER